MRNKHVRKELIAFAMVLLLAVALSIWLLTSHDPSAYNRLTLQRG